MLGDFKFIWTDGGMSAGCTAGPVFEGVDSGWPHNGAVCNVVDSCQSAAFIPRSTLRPKKTSPTFSTVS